MHTYQAHLASKGVASVPLNQIDFALRFFYGYGVTLGELTISEGIAYAREPSMVFVADETMRFLEAVSSLKFTPHPRAALAPNATQERTGCKRADPPRETA